MQENNNNNENLDNEEINKENNDNKNQDTIVVDKEDIKQKIDDTRENIILDRMKKEIALEKMVNLQNEKEEKDLSGETIKVDVNQKIEKNTEDENTVKEPETNENTQDKKEEKKERRKDSIKSTGFSFISFVAVLLILAGYTFYISRGFDTKPWEVYNTYRQSDTFSIAKIYELKGVDFFRPQVFYDGAKEHIVSREPQIYTVLSVMLSSRLNIKLEMALRYVSYAFFMLSSIYFYKLSRLFFDRKLSIASLAVYILLPVSVCISRAIMPESIVLFFYLAAVYYGFLFLREKENDYCYISAIFLAFSILEKVPSMFFIIVMIYLMFKIFGASAFKKKELYLYPLVSLIPSLFFYTYESMICDIPFSKTVDEMNIFSGFISTALNKYTAVFHINFIRESFGTYIFVLALIGFITILCRRKDNSLMTALTIFTFLEILVVASVYKQADQYVFMIPVIAILVISFVKSYRLRCERLLIIALVLSSLLYFSHRTINEKFRNDENIQTYVDTVNTVLPQNAKIAVNTDKKSYISCLDRWGARLGLKYYSYVPDDDKLELKYWIDDGITDVILLKNSENYKGFSDHIGDFADKIYSDSKMDIYKVKNTEDAK